MKKVRNLALIIGAIALCGAVVAVAVPDADLTTNVRPAVKAASNPTTTPPDITEFVGGDTCADATVIPSIPYTDSGTTAGFTNDYDEVCPFSGSTAPDVVYSYTPAVNETVVASLCSGGGDAFYDTKLYVYEDTCPGTVTNCVDDACTAPSGQSYVSELTADLTAGTTYYFVVDGYSTDSGDYTLALFYPPTCPCDPAATDLYEDDPQCGNYVDGIDPTGGCNTDDVDPGPYLEVISCNTTICGTLSAYTTPSGDSRDTDWYELNLPVADTIRVTVTSEAPLLLFDLGGEYDCANATVDQSLSQSSCGGTGEMVINGVAGPNWIWVGTDGFGDALGVPCPTEYTMTVTCDTVPVDLQSFDIE